MLRPMLAATVETDKLSALHFPLLASPKLDGFRALIIDGVVNTRSLKPIRNKHTQELFGHSELGGLDGELVVGEPTAEHVFSTTSSGVTSSDGSPKVTFYVFDNWMLTEGFETRQAYLKRALGKGVKSNIRLLPAATRNAIKLVPQVLVANLEELAVYEAEVLAQGYEGVMLRAPAGPYKHGRSTLREGYLIKLKRFVDGEATVIGFVEQLHNDNEALVNALGQLERSSHKAKKRAAGVLGKLIGRDLETGRLVDVGTGFTAEQRIKIWSFQKKFHGRVFKYKKFPVGEKDKPRFPVFCGFRDPWDMAIADKIRK